MSKLRAESTHGQPWPVAGQPSVQCAALGGLLVVSPSESARCHRCGGFDEHLGLSSQ